MRPRDRAEWIIARRVQGQVRREARLSREEGRDDRDDEDLPRAEGVAQWQVGGRAPRSRREGQRRLPQGAQRITHERRTVLEQVPLETQPCLRGGPSRER